MSREQAREQQAMDANAVELRRSVANLLQALRDENAALVEGDIERIDRCGAHKSVCLATVEGLLQEQFHLGHAFGAARDLIANDPELRRQLRDARDQNDANGVLVQSRMQYLSMALAALGATPAGPIYGRDGRARTSFGATQTRHA